MCGIIGYCGPSRADSILLDGLQKLEYRGYDSVGIACPKSSGSAQPPYFDICKEVGNTASLVRLCKKLSFRSTIGIGHCRWATHGEVSWHNAHPHTSSDGKVVLVHNGIIENYLELRKFLESKGFLFISESDTESVANLLSWLISNKDTSSLKGDSNIPLHIRALLTLRTRLSGSYALAIMFSDCPGKIFALRHESPLVAGIAADSLWIASDIIPLSGKANSIVYLENDELACLSQPAESENSAPELRLFSPAGNEHNAKAIPFSWSFETVDKQGYEHFMLKEIHEQPYIFSQMQGNYVDAENRLTGFTLSSKQIQQLRSVTRVIFASCGSSYHASTYAAYLFEQHIGLPASVEFASEFRYRTSVITESTLVIGVSQSGETADTLAALQCASRAGAVTAGIVNVATSSIARLVDIMFSTPCGQEIGVASTKVFTAQMLLLYYLTLYIAQLREKISPSSLAQLLEPTRNMGKTAQSVLEQSAEIRELGRAYAGYQHMLYLGRKFLYPLSLEGALKMKELSYIHAEGYAAAEMKHGPIALIDSTMPVIALCPAHEPLYGKMQSSIAELKARGGRILAVAHNSDANLSVYDDAFLLPSLTEELDAILFALPLQLFAYYAAHARGFNPDQPRNLAKSVTVE